MVDLDSYIIQKLAEGYREEAIKRVLVNNKYSPANVDQAIIKCRNRMMENKVDKFYISKTPSTKLKQRSLTLSTVFTVLVLFFQSLAFFFSDNQIILGISSLVIVGAITYLLFWLISTSIELKKDAQSVPSPYLLLLLLVPLGLGFVNFNYAELIVPMLFLSIVIVYLLLLLFNDDVKSLLKINTAKASTLTGTVLMILGAIFFTPFALIIYIQRKINQVSTSN
jgi:hypothetical protein